jgi:hypothetical protein
MAAKNLLWPCMWLKTGAQFVFLSIMGLGTCIMLEVSWSKLRWGSCYSVRCDSIFAGWCLLHLCVEGDNANRNAKQTVAIFKANEKVPFLLMPRNNSTPDLKAHTCLQVCNCDSTFELLHSRGHIPLSTLQTTQQIFTLVMTSFLPTQRN